MSKNNTNLGLRQPKISREQLIAQEQAKWQQEVSDALLKKEELGYKAITATEFLKISPGENLDMAAQASIYELQEIFNELRERKQLLWAEDRLITEFNEKHAVIHIDQTYILTEKTNHFGGQDFSLESRQSFKAYYEDARILCIDGNERSKADIWLKSPKRRKYEGIVFDPTLAEPGKKYNLWRGFTRNPKEGDCSKYWAHVRDVICAGDEVAYIYVRKWLAMLFQKPNVIHTALVLCGSQGTGKNSFVNPLGMLLGSHYAPLSSMSELISNFNYHLKNAVLIHANEALWGGNKKDIGTVKAMITEEFCLIESKGKDRIVVRNFKHVILSSNEDWPVHLDKDDRRFFVLRISESHKEDHAYFGQLDNELKHGGLEALLHDLLHEDISNFNPRKLPASQNSFEIKMRSANSGHRYLYEVLQDGGFSIGQEKGYPTWQPEIPKKSVYEDYVAWCRASGESILSRELLGKVLKTTLRSLTDTRPVIENRIRCYKLPDLHEAREEFAEEFKEQPERIFDAYTNCYTVHDESKVFFDQSLN